jgi:hypothetical protein
MGQVSLTTEQQPKRGLVIKWRPKKIEDLRAALEDYTRYSGAMKIRKYGDPDELAAEGRSEQETAIDDPPGMYERILRQNSEIDRRMERLRVEAPHWYKVIDRYYRTGKCDEHNGWCEAAADIGLHHDPGSRWDQDTFNVQLDLAVKKLWHTKVKGRTVP